MQQGRRLTSPHAHVLCSQQKLKGRKRWIISVPVRGAIWLEPEAVHAVKDRHRSLFSVGIVKVCSTARIWSGSAQVSATN